MILYMKKNFTKIRSIKDITISAFIIITGTTISATIDGNGAIWGGCSLIILGAILALVLKSSYKDMETGEVFKKREFTFQQKMKSTLLSAITSSPEKIDISSEGIGEGVRLEIFYSKKSGKAYLQLFEYVPFQYHPCSEMYEYKTERIKNLVK